MKNLSPGTNLEFVSVPDMLLSGAYDELIKGATYAIHVASPLASVYKEGDDWDKTLIEPAVTGTLNLLDAAKKAGTVKRVVVTSSVAAIVPFTDLVSGSSPTIFNEKNRTTFSPPPYSNSFEGYSASKVKALNDAEAWVTKEKPNFDVVYLFPSFFEGKNELVVKKEDAFWGTNAVILGPVVAGKELGSIPGTTVHIQDVAEAHVKALDGKVPGNQGYVLNSEGFQGSRWEDVKEIVEREFGVEVEKGVLKNGGGITSAKIKLDTSTTERVLGLKFKGFEEQVKDVVGHYLTLV